MFVTQNVLTSNTSQNNYLKIKVVNGPFIYSFCKAWYKNGLMHRDNGPAIIYANGDQEWWQNGQLHRDDGPVIMHNNGHQVWYKNSQLHRDDGPAIIWSNGKQEWWKNGVKQK